MALLEWQEESAIFNEVLSLGRPIRSFICIGSRSVYLARNGEGPVIGLD